MRKRLLLLVVAVCSFTLMIAQNEEKYSITTQLFLQDMAGNIDLNANTKASATEKRFGLHPVVDKQMRKYDRFVAAPDTIDGQVFMSAFVHLKNNADLSELEALGVQVQTAFGNGRITALIPVEKVEQVAALDNVTKIKAAQMMRPTTHPARQKTNVDDILTQSADAIAAGLDKVYDGSGVILGVIDTGIDFNHIAFKDKNGNSRIKRAYVYNGSTAQFYNTINSTTLTDDNTEDHGTHTSSTAGGSSVTVSGSTVTVTDDHASAAYGGMAPGADLYLAGVNGLSDTYMTNALNDMVSYANTQGKPLVVSNSWGSQLGPHDGTGDWADLVNQYFGPSHPNRVILFASSNDAGKSQGGISVSGTASSASPLGTILRSHYYSDTDDGFHYEGILASAWARSSSVSTVQCKVHVLNSSTGALVASSNTVTPTTNGAQVTGLTNYYSGTLYALKDYVDANKTQILLYASSGMESKSYTSSYQSNYTLAVEFFPSSGSSVIDVWAGGYSYFTNHLTTSGHAWTNGSSDMSVSDEATIPNAISIGAYVSRTDWRSAAGTNYTSAGEYTMDDIAPFSSYALASKSPTGLQYPWITAPGARLAAAVNHNHTKSVDASYSYYGDNFINDLVVNSTTNPYAMMEGTSMATPTAAGIVALWLQASMEEGAAHKNLTVGDVKTIMQETAINDAFTTTGANASHFGNGKIDALAGIQYILGVSGGPTIKATPATVAFDENTYVTRTYTKTVNVKGLNLEGNITASLSGNAAFSIDKTTITQTAGSADADITITWSPTVAGTQSATITLTSQNAETVTVSITGTAKPADPFIVADPEELTFTADINASQTLSVDVLSEFLADNITLTLTDASGVFSLSSTSITKAASEEGASFDVTFNAPATEGTYTGTVTLSSPGADDVTITLSATANDGGKASDAYLNIAKYATIDDAGWRTALVDNLYKYTEYKSDGFAWLTLPVYGAFVGARYATNSSTVGSGHPQAWIESSLGTSNTYGGTTWTNTASATSPFNGNSAYFTSATSRAIGYNSRTNTEIRTVSFYVTNTTEIRLSGTGRSGSSASYPARLRIYECTKNSDGTVTASTTASVNQTSSSTSTFTLQSGTLDETKIYKVETSIYRGYLYEIAFKTPINANPEITVNPTSLSMTANVGKTETKTVTVTGVNLTAGISTAISGTNAGLFSISPASLTTTGGTLNVTYAPTAAGNHTATLTLSSTGAESVTVNLNGTAAEPEMIVDPDALTFSTYAGNSVTGTFDVLGTNLNGAVTLTLNDANNVFSLSSSSMTKAQAEEGATVTVTFAPTSESVYNATVTISTEGVADQIVTLTGTATKSSVAVTINKYGLTTLYTDVPLEIPYETEEDILGVYFGKSLEEGELRVKRLNQYIPALTGVIIQGNSGTFSFPVAKVAVPELAQENVLHGTLVDLPVSEITGGIVLTMGRGPEGYIGFYKYSGTTIPAGKVYLIYNSSEAKSMNIVVDNSDGTATSISKVADKAERHDEWYTLQGVRLEGKPVGKGFYIHNGKKELLK
ncbi:MAG: S8 family serine peptidase [Bacteroidaceae bacterium]|nr:S8 family serine peptidase [Bacteroidaceae bacterium]